MHVLIIPSWYPKDKNDYRGSFFREQSIGILKKGVKVGVIYPDLSSLKELSQIRIIPKICIEDDMGLKTYRILWTNWFPKIKSLQISLYKILGYLLFKFYVKKYGEPNLIHCHSVMMAGWLAEKISDKYQIPYIITEHSSGFFIGRYKNFYKEFSRIYNKSSLCLGVSSALCDLLMTEIPSSPKWIAHNNMVSSSFFEAPIKVKSKKPFIFLTISNLIKHKNIPLLLNSFSIFNDRNPNSILNIVGVGPEETYLKNLSKSLNIDEVVFFLGRKTREEIIIEFNNANVFMLGTIYETFGIVIIEALSMGLPVIVTECGGSKDIMTKGIGKVTRQNDINDMTNSMFEIFNNYDSFKALKLRRYSKLKFSEQNLSNKLFDHYAKVIKSPIL